MQSDSEISVIVTTYERPDNLLLVLTSLSVQTWPSEKIQIVVADDGSQDHTPEIVESFRKSVSMDVQFVTHEKNGFCPSRTRNNGYKVTKADYLVFLDGDCLLPPTALENYMCLRGPGKVLAGGADYFSQEQTNKIDANSVMNSQYLRNTSYWDKFRHWRKDRKTDFYNLIRHPKRPRLAGGNFAINRKEFEAINGFDESYVGWGCEDDDLGMRLQQLGSQLIHVKYWSNAFHLWHPAVPSKGSSWGENQNKVYFQRSSRLTSCRNGILKRSLDEMSIKAANAIPAWSPLLKLIPKHDLSGKQSTTDLEIIHVPGNGTFTNESDINILVARQLKDASKKLVKQAHVVFSDDAISLSQAEVYPMQMMPEVLQKIS